MAAGENPKVVSERLGHATVAFTPDRYAHALPGMQESASEHLERILYGDRAQEGDLSHPLLSSTRSTEIEQSI